MTYMSEEHEQVEITGNEVLPFSHSSRLDSIHQIFYQGQNWYRVGDVIDALEVAKDPADYWSDMKRRIRTEGFNAACQEMLQFELKSPKDRRLRKHDYATRQTILRLLQSIPTSTLLTQDFYLIQSNQPLCS